MPRGEAALDLSLTWVELVWIEKQTEHWIRFGQVAAEQILDRRRRRVAFRPGSVFALVRWSANDAGTVASRFDILRSAPPGSPCSTTPGVTPGAESLLRISGWPRVRLALAAVDAVEALGLDPVDAAPDHWRHVHNRLMGRTRTRPYTLRRHRAWRLRQGLDA
ncbi:DUF2840 domain-containing protein [Phenylobacterium sp.]|uniref:DUF2840 domain-containing protein n=1 Tax=Phenylobacterium sp. TaxID=1871053 RepID=UPI003BA929C4